MITTLTKNNLEYSLAEILHLVHQNNQTGLISTLSSSESHYLWVQNGRIVSVAQQLDGMDLLREIDRCKLLSSAQIEYLKSRQIHKLSQPLGLYLKSLGWLDAGQLRLLFNAQTSTLLKLSELEDRLFSLDSSSLPSKAEMTGIGIPAQEVMQLLGLKVLPDSCILTDRDTIAPELAPPPTKATALSSQFLGNLMGFLKKKGS
jgi:Domain of unknown function (DUF4388)